MTQDVRVGDGLLYGGIAALETSMLRYAVLESVRDYSFREIIDEAPLCDTVADAYLWIRWHLPAERRETIVAMAEELFKLQHEDGT